MPAFMIDLGNSDNGPIGATLHVAGAENEEQALTVAREYLEELSGGVDLDCDDATGVPRVRDACVYFNPATLTLANVFCDPDGDDDDEDESDDDEQRED